MPSPPPPRPPPRAAGVSAVTVGLSLASSGAVVGSGGIADGLDASEKAKLCDAMKETLTAGKAGTDVEVVVKAVTYEVRTKATLARLGGVEAVTGSSAAAQQTRERLVVGYATNAGVPASSVQVGSVRVVAARRRRRGLAQAPVLEVEFVVTTESAEETKKATQASGSGSAALAKSISDAGLGGVQVEKMGTAQVEAAVSFKVLTKDPAGAGELLKTERLSANLADAMGGGVTVGDPKVVGPPPGGKREAPSAPAGKEEGKGAGMNLGGPLGGAVGGAICVIFLAVRCVRRRRAASDQTVEESEARDDVEEALAPRKPSSGWVVRST